MSLTPQQWKKLPVQTLGATTLPTILDAIYTALTSATYYDASARTAGAGSAWTFSRYQNAGTTEAVYGTPPTDAIAHRAIFAGVNAARTPLMASPDTWLANCLMVSVAKNAGAFASWDHASAPFTSGQFFGYWRVYAGTTAAKVHVYESQECLAVFVEETGGSVYGALAGALWDPESSDTTNDSESDGRLYGVVTSGSGSAVSATFNTTASAFLGHSVTIGNAHAGIFQPGSSSILSALRWCLPDVSTTTSSYSRAGRFYRVPWLYRLNQSAPNDRMIGRLREACLFRDGKLGNVHSESGADKAYLVGGSTTADQDCVALVAS